MCGKLNGHSEDDLLTKEGFRSKSVATFASSWKVDDLDCKLFLLYYSSSNTNKFLAPCNDSPAEKSSCDGLLEVEAADVCHSLLTNARFSSCFGVLSKTKIYISILIILFVGC